LIAAPAKDRTVPFACTDAFQQTLKNSRPGGKNRCPQSSLPSLKVGTPGHSHLLKNPFHFRVLLDGNLNCFFSPSKSCLPLSSSPSLAVSRSNS
jgi:hypothetical protein